ncbi:hypothetical protein THASP1DRAFT_31660 [Thamnocephalis sphaerospora]|uniref:Uncharacterized protein n=1 Tax=Thamnocephalis sphaerospora TaxID=78915 RepID=A0A4P9XMM6_9FUNG|nr:hypothetical protein THASP1DRAFT_31660 [Thamnocephalis sphaerospora]|eukprot:RKP06530.1 hypothetical protein THASP1DRAFT_31660 [Thamnocephalis sphaerospora]
MTTDFRQLEVTLSSNGSPLGSWINPAGEISGFDYVMNATNMAQFRTRSYGLFLQLSIMIAIVYIFAWGTIRSSQIVRRSPHGFAAWCCLIQAAVGLGINIINVITKVSSWPICRHQIYVDAVGLCIGRITINALLLSKAYYSNGKSKRLLIAGIIAMIPEPATAYVLMGMSEYEVTDTGSCSIRYPEWFPWMYSGLDVPIHAVFSFAFILVVVRQYRALGSGAWAELRRDSIVYLAGIVIFKLFMLIVVASRVAGDATATIGLVEWVICSCLIVHQQNNVRRAFQRSRLPQSMRHRQNNSHQQSNADNEQATGSRVSHRQIVHRHTPSQTRSPTKSQFERSYAIIRQTAMQDKGDNHIELAPVNEPHSPSENSPHWRRPSEWE